MTNKILIENEDDWKIVKAIGIGLGWKWAGGQTLNLFTPSMPFILYENYGGINKGSCHQSSTPAHEAIGYISAKEFAKRCSKAVLLFFD